MPLAEWEYMPCVGPRPAAGLVGLKNAGATCYMNSVLQQLYCVRAVRDALLSVQGQYVLYTDNTIPLLRISLTIIKGIIIISAALVSFRSSCKINADNTNC